MINWPVLKDIQWLTFQLTSTLSAVIGVIMAVDNNNYWVIFVFLSLLLLTLGVNRTVKLTE
ncbi:hypothetical protein ACDX78_05865 [Virgibacillus oceani]